MSGVHWDTLDVRVPRPSPIRAAAMGGAGLMAYLYAVARGLNPVCSYAFEHWLLTWDAGFIKRGLVGTLLHPLFMRLPVSELRGCVTALSVAVFAALSVTLLRAAARVAAVGPPPPSGLASWALPAVVLAFLSSSGVILAASTLGFFDHLLLLSAMVSVELVARMRLGLASALCVVTLAVHEIFALYGLPVVVFALLIQRTERPGGWRRLAYGLPPLVAFAWIAYASSHIPAARLLAVRQELYGMGALAPRQINDAVYHLEHDLMANHAAQRGMIARHMLDASIDRMAWPAMVVLVGAAVALLGSVTTSVRRAVTVPFLVLAALAPLLAHLVAWDAPRFTNLAVMQAFALLHTVVRIGNPALPGRREAVVLIVLAAVTIAANVYWEAPLMSGYVDGHGFIRVR